MAGKQSKHVRLFRSAGVARLAEADVLRENRLTMGAVYLAGYAVECTLKALILDCHPADRQADVIAGFTGARAHDFGWFWGEYRLARGAPAPKPVVMAFFALDEWGVQLRYEPRTEYDGDEGGFFAAVETVLAWANGRL